MDDVFVSYDELKVGDVFLGTSATYNWGGSPYEVVGRNTQGKVLYKSAESDATYNLWDAPDRKYRLKQVKFQYNPEQTGDTEDDI